MTVFTAAAWVKRRVRSQWLAVWAGCACALAPALAFLAAFAAAEIVFVLFVVVSLSLLDRFLGAGNRSALLLAAAAAAAASLTRYAGVTLVGAGALVLLLRRAPAVRRRIAALVRRRPGFARRRRTVLAAALVFAAAYALVPAVFLPLADVALSVGYLLPLFPPLLVVAALLLDECAAERTAKAGAVAVTIAAWTWLALPGAATYADVRRWLDTGPEVGYSAERWTESAVIRYLNRNRVEAAVWSTDAPALYFHTRRRPLAALAPSLDELTERLAGLSPAASTWVVWFDDPIRAPDYGAGEVAALPGVELIADLDDGVIYRAAGSADVIVRSPGFDILLYERALAYFKEPCADADVQADVFLHVIPAAAADLSADARARGSFFNSLDFSFAERGVIRDGRCLAVVTFDYDILRFHTGQFWPGHPPFWEVETTERQHRLLPYRRAYRAILEGAYGAPAVRSDFDLYLNGSRLTYVREPCTAKDAAAPFFLHVVPADPAGLPADLDFAFAERGAILGGACVAVAELPNYRIARLRTGQYAPEERRIWDETIAP